MENATYYEVSVWRMSESNASLVLERRASMGFGGGRALAAGGAGGAGAGARGPAPRAALGRVRRGDEAGARACNRYGCSRPLLLRPSDTLLRAADPPWWHGKECLLYWVLFRQDTSCLLLMCPVILYC